VLKAYVTTKALLPRAAARFRFDRVCDIFPRSMSSDVKSHEGRIRAIGAQAVSAIENAKSLEELETLRIKYLSRNGQITLLTRDIGKAPADQKKLVGAAVNDAKNSATQAFESRKAALESSASPKRSAAAIDVSLPGTRRPVGRRHPLSSAMEEVKSVLIGLGFSYDDYPEVETEFDNFDSLNMPWWHPARDMQDSFFTESGHVLRTHTTSFQMHAMRKLAPPPMRAFTLGRCFRRDEIDATHFPMFHQIDAIAIGQRISFSDLKWTLFEMLRGVLGKDITLRFRPSYFPFTTPSAEVDVFYRGRWMELGGSGMIHPEVFRHANLEPEKWQGFAFGLGTDRIAIARHKIDDIRLLFENDESFLRQF
jgi:phenylalanyl-tRNA synthetase alpha chain